jgi:hypothetical protein
MYPSYAGQALAVGADRFLIKGVKSGSIMDVIKEVAFTE